MKRSDSAAFFVVYLRWIIYNNRKLYFKSRTLYFKPRNLYFKSTNLYFSLDKEDKKEKLQQDMRNRNGAITPKTILGVMSAYQLQHSAVLLNTF